MRWYNPNARSVQFAGGTAELAVDRPEFAGGTVKCSGDASHNHRAPLYTLRLVLPDAVSRYPRR